MKIEQTNQENLSSISQHQQQYIQMANLTSGSSFCSSTSSSSSNPSRSSFRTNLKTTDFNKNDQDSNAVYNFPWEFKPKANPLIAQLTNNQSSSIPPPLPSVPPPQTPKLAENTNSHIESQDESQYCAPWDLKLQEEMLKLMAQNQNSTNTNTATSNNTNNNNTNSILSSNKKSNEEKQKTDSFKRNDSNSSSFRLKNEINITSTSNMSTTNNTSVTKTDAESSEYSPPWEHKQSILFQQISNSNLKQSTSQLPPPLATSSASSTLNNPTTSSSTNQSNAMSSLFNKFSLTRLSNRSNNSSSSSTRSSTSSLSASSPPSMPPPSLPPPILPPPPPPASTLPTNQSSSTLQTCNSLRCVNTNNQQQQQQSPHLIHRQLSQVGHSGQTCGFMHVQNMNNLVLNQNILQSNYLNDKNKFSTTNSSVFDTLASNVNSVLDETKQIVRQNRAGSNHSNQFTFPNQQQFQTISTGDIQVSALPVTALVFSANNNSLPTGILPLNVTVQQQQQQVVEMSSPSRFNDLERQSWFHGRITRKQAENLLNNKPIGSFLVRQSESGNSNDYSLSLVGSGCVHMRICMKNGEFILGQCSQPFTSIVKMIDHYGRVEVPIKGAQHVKLSTPIRTSG